MREEDKVTYFAKTDARNKEQSFGIKAKDRTRHMYVIGKTGMGKSTLLENMAVQDIQNGNGLAFMDPHGKTAELLLEYIPEERLKDVLYFAPFDMENPISFNVMEDVGPDQRHLVLSGLMSTFKKIWVDAWSARMEYILGNTILALLEYPDATLLSASRMLSDKNYRKKVVDNVTDVSVKSFWVDEFAKYTDRFAADATPAIQNKIGQFTANPVIRNIIGQPHSSFDIRKMMDEKKIIIINLSKGRVGESNANLLGSMLITKIYLAAMSRADASPEEMKQLPNFYLYVDEFQSFANESFANILSEARKYKLNLTIAHQYIDQMTEEVRSAVFGNVGTMVAFRVGATDAEVFEREFAPQFTAEDMVNLGFAQIYLRLMIDGIGSLPFSATTLPPIEPPEVNNMQRVIEVSREQFANKRVDVEAKIATLISHTEESAKKEGGDKKDAPKKEEEQSNDLRKRDEFGNVIGSTKHLEMQKKLQKKEHKPDNKKPQHTEQKPKHENKEKSTLPKQPLPTPPPSTEDDGFAPLSLHSLAAKGTDNSKQKRPVEKKKDPKKPSENNLASLREALSSVIKKDQQKTQNPPVPVQKAQEKRLVVAAPTPPKQEVKESPKPTPSQEKTQEKGEVPEDVLRNTLNVDEN